MANWRRTDGRTVEYGKECKAAVMETAPIGFLERINITEDSERGMNEERERPRNGWDRGKYGIALSDRQATLAHARSLHSALGRSFRWFCRKLLWDSGGGDRRTDATQIEMCPLERDREGQEKGLT